jgi:NAD(P)H-dependent FMN reductase
LRRNSFNTSLLRAAAEVLPAGVELTLETIQGIPLYDGDLEAAEGIPRRVAELKDLIASADGLLLATPEYNNSIPGPFKNAIDWMTRPPKDTRRVFGGKPLALMGASTGAFGTISGQAAWLIVLRALGTKPFFGARLVVPHADKAFDASGALQDESVREKLREFMAAFAAFVRA